MLSEVYDGPRGPQEPWGPQGPWGPRGPQEPWGPRGPQEPWGPRGPWGPQEPWGPSQACHDPGVGGPSWKQDRSYRFMIFVNLTETRCDDKPKECSQM